MGFPYEMWGCTFVGRHGTRNLCALSQNVIFPQALKFLCSVGKENSVFSFCRLCGGNTCTEEMSPSSALILSLHLLYRILCIVLSCIKLFSTLSLSLPWCTLLLIRFLWMATAVACQSTLEQVTGQSGWLHILEFNRLQSLGLRGWVLVCGPPLSYCIQAGLCWFASTGNVRIHCGCFLLVKCCGSTKTYAELCGVILCCYCNQSLAIFHPHQIPFQGEAMWMNTVFIFFSIFSVVFICIPLHPFLLHKTTSSIALFIFSIGFSPLYWIVSSSSLLSRSLPLCALLRLSGFPLLLALLRNISCILFFQVANSLRYDFCYLPCVPVLAGLPPLICLVRPQISCPLFVFFFGGGGMWGGNAVVSAVDTSWMRNHCCKKRWYCEWKQLF